MTASQSLAQQPNGWSPQPFAKPDTQAIDSRPVSIPTNSLRQSEEQQKGEVLRWGSGQRPLRAESRNTSFSQALPPAESQHQSESSRSVAVSTRSPLSVRSAAQSTEPSEPRSGFELSTSRKQTVSSQVQPASYNEVSTESAVSLEPRVSGVWYDRSAARDIQKARFQEPLGLPPAPDRIPLGPNGGLPSNRLDQESTRALNEVLEPAPFKQQLSPSKPNQSLLEPEQIPPSPFPGPKSFDQEKVDRSPSDSGEPPQIGSMRDPAPKPPRDQRIDRSVMDCDAMRSLLISESDIKVIRIDSSPSFVEGYKNPKSAIANTKEGFIASAKSRSWLSYDGQVVAEGKMVDLTLGSVVIEQANGARIKYLLHKLSDSDQVYVSEKWGLPVTCAIDDRSFPRRDFTDTTVTWKASGACHKPLYFEDVQLERYGHEWGPFAQPVISTAHFFGDVIVMPYKMGIHPPNECQYSLGYYRPGSCAPWTVGPIPISLRGALMQAKVVTGAALILP